MNVVMNEEEVKGGKIEKEERRVREELEKGCLMLVESRNLVELDLDQ